MEFQILGPVEVRGANGVVPLGGPKPRAILAVLLLHQNEPVSADRLANDVWGEEAPAATPQNVQVNVSRLRKALGDDVLATTSAGYRLRVRPGELDADRFEELVEHGRRAMDTGQLQEAAALLREAQDMWHGPPLANVADVPFASAEIARLEEQQLAAIEACVEAEAAGGQHAELVSELVDLVAKHPTRERLAGQLMLALYRSGRQAEALEAYRRTRRYLTEEIGIEPGPELKALQEAILHQDPSLKLERLPHELAAAAMSPLVGRTRELRSLLGRWERAETGAGALVAIAGAPGMGKTRLAAEVSVEAHRRRAVIVYVSGRAAPGHVLRALARAGEATSPTLVVVDDVDDAGADVVPAMRELARTLATAPALVLATGTVAERLALLRASDTLTLEPLGLEAVRAIAAGYAADNDVDAPTAEELLDASEGVPRRVHDLAGRWEATRRVELISQRAAVGRADLRTMEDDLAGSVVELQTARAHTEPHNGDATLTICPFKGLASFEAADARYFFGRDRLVAELVARLVGAPLIGVVGPSGSGKSSVVRAGLLPALEHGVLPGSEQWPLRLMRPGEHPVRELRRATADVDAGARLALAVDQFEETFTACRDEDERAAFIAELVRTAQGGHGSVVVVALRADFYGRCAEYPKLSRLLAANHVLVGSMRRAQLRQVIEGPAERVGLHVDSELEEALVSDVEHEPGALPLLSTALLELWRRRDGRHLQLASYEATGGVLGAVARLAEDAFGKLDERQQAIARSVLLRLAEVELEGGVERRRLPLQQLEADGGGDAASVIGLLADARLLTISEGTVEFAHEALLREWPRLRDWIEDDREDRRVHRNVSSAAEEWIRLERDEGALYRGARLAEAEEWAKRGDPGPTETEREFLAASRERVARERAARRRRIRIAFAGLLVALAAITAVAIVALYQGREAERQRDIAVSRELALESGKSLAVDPELGVRLALWALDTAPTVQAATALREATLAFHQLAVLDADSLDANAAAFSPDGERVLTGGADGVALVWDGASRRRVARWDAGHGAVLAARYAPGGGQIALGFEDGTVAVTDPSLADPRTVLHEPDRRVEDVAYGAHGERIAAALDDGSVRVLAADGSATPRRLDGHEGAVLGVDISAEGSRVVSAGDDGSVRLWDLSDGAAARVIHTGEDPETDVAFSPDGSRILGVGDDGWITLWNARSGAEDMRLSGQGRDLLTAAFSADGRRFAAGGGDGVTRVWSVTGGPPVAVLRGQRSRVYDVGFGPSGDRVVSAGDDGTARIWDAGRTQAWASPSVTTKLSFDRTGGLIAIGTWDGKVRVWDTATGKLHASVRGTEGYTTGTFSPIDDRVLIGSDDGDRVSMWRVSTNASETIAQLSKDRGFNAASFDGTGDRIMWVDAKGLLVVRDIGSGRDIKLLGAPKDVWDAQLSPDGTHVAAVPEAGGVLVWDVDRPARPERVLEGHRGKVFDLAYGRDGRIVTAGGDRTVRIWDPRGGPELVLRGHEDEVTTTVFTDDAARVLSSSQDGTLRLWDARTGAQLAMLRSDQGQLFDVALSADGKIATLGKGEVVRVFPCEVCGSLEQVRALALSRSPRQLTADERRQFLAATD